VYNQKNNKVLPDLDATISCHIKKTVAGMTRLIAALHDSLISGLRCGYVLLHAYDRFLDVTVDRRIKIRKN